MTDAAAAARPSLFTIGHSDHEMAKFVALLQQHGVTAIADVRSQPYSRFTPQFNRETVAEALKRAGVHYVFFGRELGARRSERESYRNGQARYELIKDLPAFQEGLDRIRRGVATQRITLMCAEKDPITCHRTVLVCRQLRQEPFDIRHILEDGTIETQEQSESRLLDLAGLPPGNLFQSRAELIEQAYEVQAQKIAYTETTDSDAAGGGGA
jgi:uncharacterized protein (DUF488 family)